MSYGVVVGLLGLLVFPLLGVLTVIYFAITEEDDA